MLIGLLELLAPEENFERLKNTHVSKDGRVVHDYCVHHINGRGSDNPRNLCILLKQDHDNISKKKITLDQVKDKIVVAEYIDKFINTIKRSLPDGDENDI